MHRELKKQEIAVSRKRVIRLMQEQGLVGRPPRRFVVTTDSNHELEIAPNLLNRNFTASAANQRWVGDITYLKTPEGWLYLAVIIDLFSRFVVGWAVSTVIDRHLVLNPGSRVQPPSYFSSTAPWPLSALKHRGQPVRSLGVPQEGWLARCGGGSLEPGAPRRRLLRKSRRTFRPSPPRVSGSFVTCPPNDPSPRA